MTNYIEIDPKDNNPIADALDRAKTIPNTIPQYPTYGQNNLQQTLQYALMGKTMSNLTFLTTGDPMVDMITMTVVQGLVLSLITLLMTQIGYITTQTTHLVKTTLYMAMTTTSSLGYRISRLFQKKETRKYARTVDIPYISDTRQINELYKAVFWYLTHDSEIDYTKEPYLQFLFDKRITAENTNVVKKDLSINKILKQEKSKTIVYKNHKITYTLSTELITVYTDKDRKRENYKVTLSTIVDEVEKTDVLEDFSRHCLTEYINNMTTSVWNQQIYTNSDGEWKFTPSNNTRKLDTIILKNSIKDNIKNDVQLFLNSEDWYKERDIPYTRGYLFYGHPGTGKTSMIKGLSLYCKRHIHFLMLSNVKSDSELMDLFKKINYKETILVIEDIDATLSLVKSRDLRESREPLESIVESDEKSKEKQASKKEQLTLAGLLNALDGVLSCHGRILIMTTNHPEVLDSALIRPGRIDGKYLFDNCNRKQVAELYEMFFNAPANQNQIDKIKNHSYSPAHITSVFLRYRNAHKKALDHLDDIETKVVIPKLVEG